MIRSPRVIMQNPSMVYVRCERKHLLHPMCILLGFSVVLLVQQERMVAPPRYIWLTYVKSDRAVPFKKTTAICAWFVDLKQICSMSRSKQSAIV